jgi:hypothetical protein
MINSNPILDFLKKHLPPFQNILPVFAITSFMVYGWTTLIYFRYLHYWSAFLNLGEISAIFCYSMLADLGESLIITFLLLAMCFVLPSRYLRDMFVVRGTLLVVFVFLSISLFINIFPDLNAYAYMVLPWTIATFVGAVLLAVFVTKIHFIVRAITWLSDSVIIFLYVLMPVTALSLLVVLARNIRIAQ